MPDYLYLRFCDNGGTWSAPRKFDLSSGKNPVITVPGGGVFRTRMEEIIIEADRQVVITGLQDNVEDLGK